jgi:hypothetical protein
LTDRHERKRLTPLDVTDVVGDGDEMHKRPDQFIGFSD